MTDLKQALEALAAADPDPAQVEALAKETLRRRETPYRENEIWQMSVQLNNALVCKLCGSTVHPVANMQVSHSVSARSHLDWHNSIERRLRKLEEAPKFSYALGEQGTLDESDCCSDETNC